MGLINSYLRYSSITPCIRIPGQSGIFPFKSQRQDNIHKFTSQVYLIHLIYGFTEFIDSSNSYPKSSMSRIHWFIVLNDLRKIELYMWQTYIR